MNPLCVLIAELIPFTILAILSKNEDFELTEKEKEILAPMWDNVLKKYMPGVTYVFSEESVLISNIVCILIQKSGCKIIKDIVIEFNH
ncbi:unnamed protein product [marine sediment metagenome]|uniref:Uncharacterized protein n=1 Tax=marine sediment metagenome TaxID=412755 RepID=X1GK72_9ZZZZ